MMAGRGARWAPVRCGAHRWQRHVRELAHAPQPGGVCPPASKADLKRGQKSSPQCLSFAT